MGFHWHERQCQQYAVGPGFLGDEFYAAVLPICSVALAAGDGSQFKHAAITNHLKLKAHNQKIT